MPRNRRKWTQGDDAMNLLILGGTVFLGRHLVEAALARGHEITLFNRGQHNPDLFPGVEKLRGDRDNDLAALAGRRWDAVIDTCGYIPRAVRQSAQLLADAVDHYTFVSSLSVYADFSKPGIDESAPVGRIDDPTVEQVTGETYGPLKALCEEAAEAAMPGRVFNVRPGLIVGPNDPTDRFTYQGLHGGRRRRCPSPATKGLSGRDHRRPRPGRVDHPHGGSTQNRRSQRHRPCSSIGSTGNSKQIEAVATPVSLGWMKPSCSKKAALAGDAVATIPAWLASPTSTSKKPPSTASLFVHSTSP
ncbi:MAG: hypothetical protein R2856_29775 [Caldilineaceae bacterium]